MQLEIGVELQAYQIHARKWNAWNWYPWRSTPIYNSKTSVELKWSSYYHRVYCIYSRLYRLLVTANKTCLYKRLSHIQTYCMPFCLLVCVCVCLSGCQNLPVMETGSPPSTVVRTRCYAEGSTSALSTFSLTELVKVPTLSSLYYHCLISVSLSLSLPTQSSCSPVYTHLVLVELGPSCPPSGTCDILNLTIHMPVAALHPLPLPSSPLLSPPLPSSPLLSPPLPRSADV